jgi:phosphoenolpyruvate-protein phosphotransferase (PTS system enzyme I)
MAELRFCGRAASVGFAAGPVAILWNGAQAARGADDPTAETMALRNAIAGATDKLVKLAAHADTDGADILAFQIAMLEDESLFEGALAAIGAGVAADRAWRAALETQIAVYEAADDENFRARASDLKDIRDQVLAMLSGAATDANPPAGTILVGEDLTPSRFLSTDWSVGGGIALARGSTSSHVATLARARGVPMIVGLGFDPRGIAESAVALIDGENATLYVDPETATREDFVTRVRASKKSQRAADAFRTGPAITADGTPIAVCVNIGDPIEVEALDPESCDGIGLVRTEFLFSQGLPDEETQYREYRRLAEWAAGKPVKIRTLDAGADKPIAGLTLDRETNPFLGVRGIRLSLAKPEPFRTQLRAICRAAAHGAIAVMLPMVAVPRELEAARGLLEDSAAELRATGVPHRRPDLGIMVEVPAAALGVEAFDAAFFSIGSNDLTQYVMAAARDSYAVAELNDPSHPAVLRLIAEVAAYGARTGREVSLCGDAGGDPKLIEALLTSGLRALSVSPAALGVTKEAIARVDLGGRG